MQVRFWDLGKGFHHAYILTEDNQGVTHFRAGPAHPGPLGTRLLAFLLPGSPRAQQWGALRAEHGPYVAGSPDYDPGSPPAMTVSQDSRPCGVINLLLSGAELTVNAARIPYDPTSTNCNAFVCYALARIHVIPPDPPVPTPGWHTVLVPELTLLRVASGDDGGRALTHRAPCPKMPFCSAAGG